jgi:hypothetical protein
VKQNPTILTAYERWVAFCRYAERFGYNFPPQGDQQFAEHSSRFLDAALALSPREQFVLREQMHDYGCPYALHRYEERGLGDLIGWRPSSEPQLLLERPHDNTRNS